MRAAIIICVCLGVATVASAESFVTTVSGAPRDLEVWRQDVASVATSTGVYMPESGNEDSLLPSSSIVGTWLSPSNCFAGVQGDGTVFSNPVGCVPLTNILPVDVQDDLRSIDRVRHTPSGTGYAAVRTFMDPVVLLTADAGVSGPSPWARLPGVSGDSNLPTGALAVMEMAGGVPHALFGLQGTITPYSLLWYTGSTLQSTTSTPLPPLAVDLVDTGGPFPLAFYGSAAGLFRGGLVPAPGTTPGNFTPVTVLDAGAVGIVSVDVNTGRGSVHGEGFGLAVGTVTSTGELVVLGAVPADSAADAGTLWRVQKTLTDQAVGAQPLQVACVDASYCVITLNDQANNLVIYANTHIPELTLGPDLEVAENGSATRSVRADDLDGDPARVTASVDPGVPVTLQGAGGVDSLDLQLSVGEVCKDEQFAVKVFASDGLGAHDQQSDLRVLVRNTAGPAAPSVNPSSTSTSAGGASRQFTAAPGPDTCVPATYVWSPADPRLVTSADGSATFRPPDVVCHAGGEDYTFTVSAVDVGGLAGVGTPVTVHVSPWGRPSVPFKASGNVWEFVAGPGKGVDLEPTELHPCVELGPDVPPVETVWSLGTSPQGLPPGVTLRDSNGNVVTQALPVVSPLLRVEAETCTSGLVVLSAKNRLEEEGGVVLESASIGLNVDVKSGEQPFEAGTLDLDVRPVGDGQFAVTPSSPLDCPQLRELRARLTVRNSRGEVLAQRDDVPMGEAWQPSLPRVCSAADFTFEGQLRDVGVTPASEGALASPVVVPAETGDIQLAGIDKTSFVAVCGEGASATLTQEFPPQACTDVELAWSQVSGPPISFQTPTGRTVQAATVDKGLQELVGESVVLRVTADAGSGKSVSVDHPVTITSLSFVEVRHGVEVSGGADRGLVGVVVELRNTTSCGVSEVRFEERLEGAEWVPDTVKLDGQPVKTVASEGGFAVEGLVLDGLSGHTLTYVARPRLLASPRYDGQAFLKGQPVSAAAAEAPASSGCGCMGGGGAGPAVFGLALLALTLRRRRGSAGV